LVATNANDGVVSHCMSSVATHDCYQNYTGAFVSDLANASDANWLKIDFGASKDIRSIYYSTITDFRSTDGTRTKFYIGDADNRNDNKECNKSGADDSFWVICSMISIDNALSG
jgi:hypothetical protein